MTEFEKESVSVYEDLCKAPSLDKLLVTKDDTASSVFYWEALWTHRDIVRNSKLSCRTNGMMNCSDGKLDNLKCSTTEVNGEKFVRISPSGKLRAVLRESTIDNEKHYFLEIWNGSRKNSNINLTDQKKHGIVHCNAAFGSLEWSHDGKKLAYIAEKKIEKSKSYFAKCNDKSETDSNNIKGNQFIYKENWGELLVEAIHPAIFIYDTCTGEITDLSDCFPEDISIAKVLWSSDDRTVFAEGWKSSPWKLGLIYCKNRLSFLYELDLETLEPKKLTGENSCVFSPRLSPDGSKLVYLETIPFAAHGQCSKLMCINLKEGVSSHKVIVDRVGTPSNCIEFQGLFVDALPMNSWLSDTQIILHSVHRSNIALLCVDITSGTVTILEKQGAWNSLFVSGDILFVSHSLPNMPTALKAGKFHLDKIEWKDLDFPFSQMDDIAWSIHKYEPSQQNSDHSEVDFEAILIKPSIKTPTGLIINPHGGPHSCYVSGFDPFSAGFCRLGFAVLRVNYRGSLGFGQSSVESLAGHVGTQDVCDVQQAAVSAVKDLNIPPGKVFIHGGSHGGFLTLHLVGQYPDFYAAGATRNPVSDISSMACCTDIMDWCRYETGVNFGHFPTAETLVKMLNASPVRYVSQVKAPLLFMIGSEDLRVPPQQSHMYIHALQGEGKNVKVLKYDKNSHPISKVDAEADCFVQIAKWFFEINASNVV